MQHFSGEAIRLVKLMAAPGAFAAPAVENAKRIAIMHTRKGISVRAGSCPRDAAETLIGAGLAAWRADGRHLSLTAEGHAKAARLCAPDPSLAFRAQHGALAMETEGKGGPVRARDHAESPLAWLARRRSSSGEAYLDAAALEAGERLRRDITFAQLLPGVTARWDGVAMGNGGGGSPGDFPDAVLAARQRVDAALKAVGQEMSGLLLDVCGFLKGLEAIEGERRWPARSAKLVLKIALGQLARHYGLSSEARGRAASVGIRSWGAPDAHSTAKA